jgi:GTP-dependent dephospho-CoA kinase
MSVYYVITPDMLSRFKEPFGELIEGSFSQVMEKLDVIVKKEKPVMIISVGDTVSRNLHKHEIIPHISITDDQSMRQKLEPLIFPKKALIKIKNPKGTITQEAIQTIKDAINSKNHVQILIDGEEDLLTLIGVLYAPEKSFVIYGQPNRGLVIVRITAEKKKEAKRIWKIIKTSNKKPER